MKPMDTQHVHTAGPPRDQNGIEAGIDSQSTTSKLKGEPTMKTFKLSTLAVSLSAALLSQPAHAVLERMGPTVQANGYPAWYQDSTGLSLEFCTPLTPAELDGGYCLLLPGDVPAVPEVFPGSFFDEHFFWAAGALMNSAANAKASITLALEAAFGGAVEAGGQITFTRIRVLLNPVPVSGTYRFIHPYGEERLEGTAGSRIFFTDDVGIGARGDFSGAMTGRTGPFLLASDVPGGPELPPVAGPVAGKLYIAAPARVGSVTGSPLPAFLGSDGLWHNHNTFRIEGPAGSNLGGPNIDFIETTDFSLMGRVYAGTMPNLVVADRASYARTATEQKVDVYATALPTAASRLPAHQRPAGVAPVTSFFDSACQANFDSSGNFVSYSAPAAGGNEILMGAQGTNRYAQLRPPPGAPLPDEVCLKDNSAVDVNGQQVPVYHPLPVNDVVLISEGTYDPVAQTLLVSANSSDMVNPPTLTLANFGIALNAGTVTVPGVTAPPSKVSVISSSRGHGAHLVDTMAALSSANTVFASSDVATTAEEVAVLIPVIAGDLLNGEQINPAYTPITLTVISGGSKGVVVANSATGGITYTPNLNASGVDSFSYTVTAGGVTSNIATVTVHITPVNDAPVGVADSAVGPRNTVLNINVLGNDTDLDGDTLAILAGSVSAPAGPTGSTSSASANANGTIAFTANNAGTYQLTYRATDGAANTAATTVTVTVSPPDTITVGAGDYVAKSNRWKVTGSTSVAAPHNLVLKLTGVVNGVACTADGRVLATIPSAGTSYTFDFVGTGLLDPRTTNCNRIRVDSALGGASANFTYRLK